MTAKPPAFPIIYQDGESLFLEWTGSALRFPFTEAGLHKALRHIPNVTRAPGYIRPGHKGNIVDRLPPKIAKSTQRRREVLNFSPEQRSAVDAILRKRGGSQ
jgi:hypothetical protein